MIALFLHSFQRVRTLVLSVGLFVGLLQVVLVLVASSIQISGQFEQLAQLFPPFVRALIGPTMTAVLSFKGIVSLGYFEPAIIFAVVAMAIAVGTRIGAEVETGFIDLLLARPVARHRMITRAIVVAVVALCVVLGLMLTGTWVGLRTIAPEDVERPSQTLILSLAVNLWLLGLAWAGIAQAVAAGSRRRGVAGGICGILALVTFLLDFIARLWEPAQPYGWMSPFTYFNPTEMVSGAELPLQHVAVLAGIAVAGFAASYVVFLRRDIAR